METQFNQSSYGSVAKSVLSPVGNVTYKRAYTHTHTIGSELDLDGAAEVSCEFRLDKSPLNLSS